MNAIDCALLKAFSDLTPGIQADRVEAARRHGRLGLPTMKQPLRDGCLVLRASDSRIDEVAGDAAPDYGPAQQRAHHFHLWGRDIAYLNEPLFVGLPGVIQKEMARLLGRRSASIKSWVHGGVFRYHTINAHSIGKPGGDVKLLSTFGPMRPTANRGEAPHPVFGSIWQYLHERIPENFRQAFYRQPYYMRQGEGRRFMGWKFRCPGLGESHEGGGACGRFVERLFSPTSTWTLFQALDIRLDLDVGGGCVWQPGLKDPLLHRRSFACRSCWRLRYTDHSRPRVAWNHMVTQLTGGLLYGCEVPIPEGSDMSCRKNTYGPSKRIRLRADEEAAIKRGAAVVELLRDSEKRGMTVREIAVELGASYDAIGHDLGRIYKRYDVHSRGELLRVIGGDGSRETASGLDGM